jgi:hypothetical protein
MPPRDSIGVKQRIVAMIRRAKEIHGNELFSLIYQHHINQPKRTVLKMHIYELRRRGYPIYAAQPEQRVWVYGWGEKVASVKEKSRPGKRHWNRKERGVSGQWQ